MLSFGKNVGGNLAIFNPSAKKPPIKTKKQKKMMYHKLLFALSHAFLPVNTSFFLQRSVISVKDPNYHVHWGIKKNGNIYYNAFCYFYNCTNLQGKQIVVACRVLSSANLKKSDKSDLSIVFITISRQF